MRTLEYLKSLTELFKKEDIVNIRDYHIERLIRFEDCNLHYIFDYEISINEKLGYNNSLNNFIKIICDKIKENLQENKIEFHLEISQLGTDSVIIDINDIETSIRKDNTTLDIKFNRNDINSIVSTINHELHHIFINSKGNKTNKEYYLVNDLIGKYEGKTKAFLILYYLSFKDEISSNIQMFNSMIGENNIKTNSQFVTFLNRNDLYNAAIKMKNIDIFKYFEEIKNEGNLDSLISDFNIRNLDRFLLKTSKFIEISGDEYIHKMSRVFI